MFIVYLQNPLACPKCSLVSPISFCVPPISPCSLFFFLCIFDVPQCFFFIPKDSVRVPQNFYLLTPRSPRLLQNSHLCPRIFTNLLINSSKFPRKRLEQSLLQVMFTDCRPSLADWLIPVSFGIKVRRRWRTGSLGTGTNSPRWTTAYSSLTPSLLGVLVSSVFITTS